MAKELKIGWGWVLVLSFPAVVIERWAWWLWTKGTKYMDPAKFDDLCRRDLWNCSEDLMDRAIPYIAAIIGWCLMTLPIAVILEEMKERKKE